MTVGDLIKALQQVPPNAELWWANEDDQGKAILANLELYVWARDGEVRLYVDIDEAATRSEFERCWMPLDQYIAYLDEALSV